MLRAILFSRKSQTSHATDIASKRHTGQPSPTSGTDNSGSLRNIKVLTKLPTGVRRLLSRNSSNQDDVRATQSLEEITITKVRATIGNSTANKSNDQCPNVTQKIPPQNHYPKPPDKAQFPNMIESSVSSHMEIPRHKTLQDPSNSSNATNDAAANHTSDETTIKSYEQLLDLLDGDSKKKPMSRDELFKLIDQCQVPSIPHSLSYRSRLDEIPVSNDISSISDWSSDSSEESEPDSQLHNEESEPDSQLHNNTFTTPLPRRGSPTSVTETLTIAPSSKDPQSTSANDLARKEWSPVG